jgi:hypothetical protein
VMMMMKFILCINLFHCPGPGLSHRIVCTVFFVLFLLCVFILIFLSVLMCGLLPPSDNSIEVIN